MEPLQLRKIFDVTKGKGGEPVGALYEVVGLPIGQEARIESVGDPNKQWRIQGIPAFDLDKDRNFATPEQALAVLQQELGHKLNPN